MASISGENRGGESHRENLLMAQKYNNLEAVMADILRYLPNNAAHLNVSKQQCAAMTAAKAAYDTAYRNPATHTRAAVMEIQIQYDAATEEVHALQQQIKNDPKVDLSGDDYTALHIHQDKTTRTPTPAETVAPSINEIETKHLENRFRASYPSGAGEAHMRLPYFAKANRTSSLNIGTFRTPRVVLPICSKPPSRYRSVSMSMTASIFICRGAKS